MGRARAAVRVLRRSLDLHEKCWKCWAILGDAEASVGRLGSAVVAYHRLLGLRPDLARGWYNLALLYERLGYPRQAAHASGRSMRVAQYDPELRAIIGVAEDRPPAEGAIPSRRTYLPN